MTQHNPFDVDALDRWLEGTMETSERVAFEEWLAEHPELQSEIDLDHRLVASLRNQFAPPTPNPQLWQHLLIDQPHPAQDVRPRLRRQWIAIGAFLAACVAWILVARQLSSPASVEPVFVRRPLVDVYRETVSTGFQPYYDCRDPERFAQVFQERQGLALKLAQLPADRRMLGLSYPGGLSRLTTGMLCEVNGQPVMVFIDRLGDDVKQGDHALDGLHVFRQVLESLVLYEVTPWNEPRMLDFIALR